MRRVQLAAALCVAFCLGATGIQVFARQKQETRGAERRAGAAKTVAARSRYLIVRLVVESQIADRANEEAARGWEVVQVIQVNSSPQFDILFRRTTEARD
jgi:hypothetical protein